MAETPPKNPPASDGKPTDDLTTSGSASDNGTNGNDNDTNNGGSSHDDHGSTPTGTSEGLPRPYAPRRNFWIHCYYCGWEGEERGPDDACDHTIPVGPETYCKRCLDGRKDPHHKNLQCPKSPQFIQRLENFEAGLTLPKSPLSNEVLQPEIPALYIQGKWSDEDEDDPWVTELYKAEPTGNDRKGETFGSGNKDNDKSKDGIEYKDDVYEQLYDEPSTPERQTEFAGVSHWSEESSDSSDFDENPSPEDVGNGGDDRSPIVKGDDGSTNSSDESQTTSEDGDDDDMLDVLIRRRSFPMDPAEQQEQPCNERLQRLKHHYERELAKLEDKYKMTVETLNEREEAREGLAKELRAWEEWALEKFEGAENVSQANRAYEREVKEFLDESELSMQRAATASKLALARDRFFKHLTREVNADPPITDYEGAENLLRENKLTISKKVLAAELKRKDKIQEQLIAAGEELKEANEEIERRKDQLRTASEQIDDLHQDASGSTQEINGLRDMMESCEAKSEAAADASRKEIEDLKAEVAELKAKQESPDACKDEKDQIGRMQITLNDRDATIRELREQLELARPPAKTSESTGNTADACKAEKEEIKQLQTSLSECRGKLKEKQAQLDDVEAGWQAREAEKDEKISSLEAQLASELAGRQDMINEHEDRVDELNSIIAGLGGTSDATKVIPESDLAAEVRWLKQEGRNEMETIKKLQNIIDALKDQGNKVCHEAVTGHEAEITHLKNWANVLDIRNEKLRVSKAKDSRSSAEEILRLKSSVKNLQVQIVKLKSVKRATTADQGSQTVLHLALKPPGTSAFKVDRTSTYYTERLNFWKTCTPAQAQLHRDFTAKTTRSIYEAFRTKQRQMASVLGSCQQRSAACMQILRQSRAVQAA